MSGFNLGFTADDLPSNQAKRNIIEIFNNNELYGIEPRHFIDTDVYNQDFNQKLYKFFTYGYIINKDVRKQSNEQRDMMEVYNKNLGLEQFYETETNDNITHIKTLIININDTFLNELLTQKLISKYEIDFLTREKFTTFVYNPNVHVANFRLRLENLKKLEVKEVHDDDWIMYDNIIKCIIYRLYLKLYPSDSKTGDQYKNNDENSMDIANPEKEKKEDIQRKLQKLEEIVLTYTKLHKLGGRTKKTIKNKLKKRKTKKMKINKKNKRRH
jgi:hypothetical protein